MENHRILDTLTEALSRVCSPEKMIKDCLSDTTSLLQQSGKYGEARENVINLCRVFGMQSHPDTSPPLSGKYYQAFRDRLKGLFEEAFGTDASNIPKSGKAFYEKIKKIFDQLREVNMKIVPPESLSSYSPWLARFSATEQSMVVEIPGQYSSTAKPIPEHHVKISRFHDTVSLIPFSSFISHEKISVKSVTYELYPVPFIGGNI